MVKEAEKAWPVATRCGWLAIEQDPDPLLLPTACYPFHDHIPKHVPHLRPAPMWGRALGVGATLQAHRSCQHAGRGVLPVRGYRWPTLRPYRREGLYDGSDRAAPCLAPRRRGVRAWGQGTTLTLAIAPTVQGEALVALVIRGVDRRGAIPLAGCLKPGGREARSLCPAGSTGSRSPGSRDRTCAV